MKRRDPSRGNLVLDQVGISVYTCLSHHQSDDHHVKGVEGHETPLTCVHGMHCGPAVALGSRHPETELEHG